MLLLEQISRQLILTVSSNQNTAMVRNFLIGRECYLQKKRLKNLSLPECLHVATHGAQLISAISIADIS